MELLTEVVIDINDRRIKVSSNGTGRNSYVMSTEKPTM